MGSNIKVISFDVEGTLVTPDFSKGMWFECIPEYYGKKNKVPFEKAVRMLAAEYDRVGDGRLEWYDVRHWFKAFDLGDYHQALQRCLPRIRLYPESEAVLKALGRRYRMIVISASIREFLEYLVADIKQHFESVISTVTDYKELKTPELYARICHDLNISPSEVVQVGDNLQYDFVNPRAAGLQAVHLDRRGQRDGKLVVADLTEFCRLLPGDQPLC